MLPLTINAESVDASGALAIVHAASDELQQRYGDVGDNQHLRVDELRPPDGLFLVARSNATSSVASGFERSAIRHCASPK